MFTSVLARQSLPSKSAAAISTLGKALRVDEEEVRRLAAVELSRLGSKAKAATPELRIAARDSSNGVRVYAAMALLQIDLQTPGLVAPLIETLKDEDNS